VMRFAIPLVILLIGFLVAVLTAQSVFAPRGGDVGEPWGQAIFPFGVGLCLIGVVWLFWAVRKKR